VNKYIKLLLTEAFLAQNSPNSVWWPSSAGTRWGSLQRSQDPLAGLRGAYFKRKGMGREWREGRKKKGGRGREGDGKERERGKGRYGPLFHGS